MADQADPLSAANRLRWRCRRGMLELDLLLAQFLDTRLGQLSERDLACFLNLLDRPDADLWAQLCAAPGDSGALGARLLAMVRERA
ncbi:MAG: succinate dehydrogenase assembly factor 2 [Betaproteobacteria bacterium]|nr:succinate dehydrogenase assembly factor 2 [Betaproteobacteria bacterium]